MARFTYCLVFSTRLYRVPDGPGRRESTEKVVAHTTEAGQSQILNLTSVEEKQFELKVSLTREEATHGEANRTGSFEFWGF